MDGQCNSELEIGREGTVGEETQNRAVWRQLVRNIDPTQKLEKMQWRTKEEGTYNQ